MLLKGWVEDPYIREVPAPILGHQDPQPRVPNSPSFYYDRLLAVDYALTWSEDGTNGNHNDAYPDWGFDDCTNFISQAAHAAHHHMTGSGDGCRYEGTATEWYIRPNPDPPFWCVGDFPDWEWSTSWTVTWDFRNYFAYQHDYAQVIGWTLDHTLANYYLTLGRNSTRVSKQSGAMDQLSHHDCDDAG